MFIGHHAPPPCRQDRQNDRQPATGITYCFLYVSTTRMANVIIFLFKMINKAEMTLYQSCEQTEWYCLKHLFCCLLSKENASCEVWALTGDVMLRKL